MEGTDRTSAPHDEHYIRATSALADERARVLKHGDTFAVFDRFGDIRPTGRGEQGVFDHGTRFLSRCELLLWGARPVVLSSSVRRDNVELIANLTNPDRTAGPAVRVERDTIHLQRETVLYAATMHQRIRVQSYAATPVDIALSLRFASDFADIFEVRGSPRSRRGTRHAPALGDGTVVLGYDGVDGILRRTVLSVAPTPGRLDADEACWHVRLAPGAHTTLEIMVRCEGEDTSSTSVGWRDAVDRAASDFGAMLAGACTIATSSASFDACIRRAGADLAMLLTRTSDGVYPYAGVPWFCTPFGRDGLITALELLWADPAVAAGVLRWLAGRQATSYDPEADAEPGKIVHEMRDGEMARIGEVPFRRYYGSVDATPLFVWLVGLHHERTGDDALVNELWPAVERALGWIERDGDRDGDGFVEYARKTEHGLQQQGWKDSKDSVFHADGEPARGPIALCEVQAYVYGALQQAAILAHRRGDGGRATALLERAERLRRRFEEAFWSDELGTYVLALDGDKRPCRVRTSNAGHALLTGIASPERAAAVVRTLLDDAGFSGWGIRTVGAGERRYNPMSYHNGSVWPHDNALIALGCTRYGLQAEACRVLEAAFDAAQSMDLRRLPELYCGFARQPDEGPTLYPVACAPQAWSAGALFLLLQAALGLHVDGRAGRLLLTNPTLPSRLHVVTLGNLRVGRATVDLELRRHGHDVGVHVLRREGTVEIVSVK